MTWGDRDNEEQNDPLLVNIPLLMVKQNIYYYEK